MYCSLEARSTKIVQLQKHVLTRFGNPCDIPFRSSGITRSPHKEKEVRKEHERYRYQRGNRGKETIDEVCQEAMSCYEKRGEEFVETFKRMSNQTIDLFEKTLGVYQATSVPDAQRRVQDLIKSSLSALQVNIHSSLNTNAKIIASWKELSRIVSARELIA